MSNLDKDPETARQGQRTGHLIIILTVSTVLAALAMWGLYTLWASEYQTDQIDEAGAVSGRTIGDDPAVSEEPKPAE